MVSELTFRNFLKDLGMRIGAAAIVVGIFIGVGYIKRTNLFGLSSLLESQLAFLAAVFLVIGLVAVSWVIFQQSRV